MRFNAGSPRRTRIRRLFALGFGLLGALVMTLDSLGHFSRGFVWVNVMLIVAVGLGAALVGLLIGVLVGRLVDRSG